QVADLAGDPAARVVLARQLREQLVELDPAEADVEAEGEPRPGGELALEPERALERAAADAHHPVGDPLDVEGGRAEEGVLEPGLDEAELAVARRRVPRAAELQLRVGEPPQQRLAAGA